MNFLEKNKIIYTWLLVSGILSLVVACMLLFIPLPDYFKPSYSNFTFLLSFLCVVPAFVFLVFRPTSAMNYEEEMEHHSANVIAMSRNAYLFTILMFFTGLITLSSTASMVSSFFFILGVLALLTAHILHILSLLKYKQR